MARVGAAGGGEVGEWGEAPLGEVEGLPEQEHEQAEQGGKEGVEEVGAGEAGRLASEGSRGGKPSMVAWLM